MQVGTRQALATRHQSDLPVLVRVRGGNTEADCVFFSWRLKKCFSCDVSEK